MKPSRMAILMATLGAIGVAGQVSHGARHIELDDNWTPDKTPVKPLTKYDLEAIAKNEAKQARKRAKKTSKKGKLITI